MRHARFNRVLSRRFGNLMWDAVLRGTGVVALLGIPLAASLPAAAPLIGFVLVTIWVNGPLSPFLPATFEPILIAFGQTHPPLVIACLATAGTVYVEALNYPLYRHVLMRTPLAAHRTRTSRWAVRQFTRRPFLTIWMCSILLPYWPVRIMSPLAAYPLWRHLASTALGRFPRLWFIASVGRWITIDGRLLVAVAATAIMIAGAGWWTATRRTGVSR